MKIRFLIAVLFLFCTLVTIASFESIQRNFVDWFNLSVREKLSLEELMLPSDDYPEEQERNVNSELKYKTVDLKYSITLFLVPRMSSFNMYYLENRELISLSQFETFDIIVNGGYFTTDLRHAGLYVSDGQQKVPLAPRDKQLNGVVRFSIDRGLEIIHKQNYQLDNSAIFEFQTGPFMVEKNIISQESINKSLNGMTKHTRTFLGYSNDYVLIIGISAQPVTLLELSETILESVNLPGLNLINLDGGSSTAIYLRQQNDRSFRSFKQLPFLIGVKFE